LSVGADNFYVNFPKLLASGQKIKFLIPDWTYFHCPGTTLAGEWPENQILISNWTYFHCPGATPCNVGENPLELGELVTSAT